ncbi:hypothetical protein RHS01_04660 [Rhizoctonia solani]|uniref:Uncharacterized protein n=1 Tax=Rhizoctonia solani TaxID=456999 RepID=A0A8H7M7A2_9AGAM|nr:hypothetical protein RHS01_04660 [Rhizoctonia solani]
MESRRQYYDYPPCGYIPSQHIPYEPYSPPAVVPGHLNQDILMALPPPVDGTHDPLSSPLTPLSETSDGLPIPEDEAAIPMIEFSTQWNNRREAQWDIVGPKRGTQSSLSAPDPQLGALLKCGLKYNIYDAQDVLPYFSVGQTILASKTPRALARSVLLTRNLHDICADWTSGIIKFTVRVRYKLQLNRPKKWKPPGETGKLANVDCSPMDPIQFRKLKGCYEAGVPVRVLATGDFPSLPTPRETEAPDAVRNHHWQDGVVMLGFFWIKKVEASVLFDSLDNFLTKCVEQKVEHVSENVDLETGKCSGRSKWELELNHLEEDDNALELGNAHKRRRVDANNSSGYWGGTPVQADPVYTYENGDRLRVEATPGPFLDPMLIDPVLRDKSPSYTGYTLSGPPSYPSSTGGIPAPGVANQMDIDHSVFHSPPPEIHPYHLGLSLDPLEGTENCLVRAPKVRASLLLGWHCSSCGRLNSRRKWSQIQTCPLCKTPSKFVSPQWHRRAHTEAAGPIGTLFRLDDGLTFVEYWLAEAPMPILAELKRIASISQRKARGKASLPKGTEIPEPKPIPSAGPSTLDFNPGTSLPTAIPESKPQTSGPKPGVHPDGLALVRRRDPGGSRVVFSEDTRMLFMQITCPQNSSSLESADQIFSGFAADVPMERQENSTSASTLSCHYTYLAGSGTHIMHTSSPAVDWEYVPTCVYDAHALLVDHQAHAIFSGNDTIREFNQSLFILGNGSVGTNTFRMTHKAEDGPTGYMVFGASCSIEILVGNGENVKRTTKGEATRRAEVLLAHGDALMTMPLEGDPPMEMRVKRTGLAIVVIARHVSPDYIHGKTVKVVPQKEHLPVIKKLPAPAKRDVTPAKRKAYEPDGK